MDTSRLLGLFEQVKRQKESLSPHAYIQSNMYSVQTGLDDVIMLSRFSWDQLFGWTHIGHRTLAYSIGHRHCELSWKRKKKYYT